MKIDSSLPGKRLLADSAAPQCRGSGSGIPFNMIPQDDLDWVADQKPAVFRLFADCWRSDPYGTRWMPLTTKVKDKALKQAKAALRQKGLFDFESRMKILENRRYYETFVINLHGSRRDSFWYPGGVVNDPTKNQVGYSATPGGVVNDPSQGSLEPQVGSSKTPGGVVNDPTNSPQTLTQSGVQERSGSFQYLFSKFLESLSDSERENFLDFGRKKAGQLPKPPELPDKWIAANWEDLYRQFQVSAAGRKAKLEAIAAKYDWRNDPRFDDWIWKAFNGGYPWTQEDEAEREQRYAFWEWAQDTNAYEGVCYQ